MLIKNSRYKEAKAFSKDEKGDVVFPGLRAREIATATGVIEHEIQAGDRLDHLARHYYNNDRLWWRIVDANPNIQFAQKMLHRDMAGEVILIPKINE